MPESSSAPPIERATIRARELTAVLSLVSAPHESALLIVGERGLGKSRLLAAVQDVAGVATYRVRINPSEATMPLSGLSAIVASFDEPRAATLSRTLLVPSDGRQSALISHAAELLALVRSIPDPAMLLLIDDVDLMDHASQSVLAMAAARLGGTGLRLAATTSAEPLEGPLASLPILKLARLNFAESMDLVSEVIGARTDEAVHRILVMCSGGNPDALTHNARALTRQQLSGAAPISLPFRATRRPDAADTASSAPSQRRLLERLSCAALTSRAAIQLATETAALDEVLSSGMATSDGRFVALSDPLMRSEIYWSLDPTSREELHASAARDEAEFEPGLAAWHGSWAATEPPRAMEMLEAAATFVRLGRIGQAVELSERALAIGRDPADCAPVLLELAEALFLQGELAYADRYSRLGQRIGVGRVASRLATLRIRIEFMSSHELRTADADDWIVGDDGWAPDDAAFGLAVAALHHAERWEADAARESLERAARLLHAATDDVNEMFAAAAMLVAAVEGDREPTDAMVHQISHAGFTQAHPMTLLVLGRCLTLLDLHSAARRIFRVILNLEPAPDLVWLETARYFHAENEILAGNQFEAVPVISELDDRRAEGQMHRNLHRVLMVWHWYAVGDEDAALEAAAECHQSLAGGTNVALAARLAAFQGSFALTQGRYDEAIAILRSAGAGGAQWANPNLLRSDADLIEACVLAGRTREAVAEFREFHARSLSYRTRWTTLAVARANALVTPGDASIKAFQQAVRLWHPGDSPFELGRTLLSYADRLASLGRSQESKEQYLAAQMVFAQLGASPWMKRTESSRSTGSAGPQEHPLLKMLAPDERIVVEMVSQGLHNKEIAAKLFVSLRTVEVRLTRVYHKLGARSRAHLTAMLSNGDASGIIRGIPDWADAAHVSLEAVEEDGAHP